MESVIHSARVRATDDFWSQEGTGVFGGVLQDGSAIWQSNGRDVILYNLKDNRKIEKCGLIRADDEEEVVQVCEGEILRGVEREKILFIATQNNQNRSKSRIMMFKLPSLLYISSLILPYSPSALIFVPSIHLQSQPSNKAEEEEEELAEMAEQKKLQNSLLIGTKGGKLLLIPDLHLLPVAHDVSRRRVHSISIQRYDSAAFFAEGKPIPCIEIDTENNSTDEQLMISKLSLLIEIDALAVGYSNSSFKLLSLSSLKAVHSSEEESKGVVTHFLYQQMADDCFGFIWVIRGAIPSASPSLQFSSKEHSGRTLYQLRFESFEEKSIDKMKNINLAYEDNEYLRDSTVINCWTFYDNTERASKEAVGMSRAVFVVDSISRTQPLTLQIFNVGDFHRISEALAFPLGIPASQDVIDTSLELSSVRDLMKEVNEFHEMDDVDSDAVSIKSGLMSLSFNVFILTVDVLYYASLIGRRHKALQTLNKEAAMLTQEATVRALFKECQDAELIFVKAADLSISSSTMQLDIKYQRERLFDLAISLNLVSVIAKYVNQKRRVDVQQMKGKELMDIVPLPAVYNWCTALFARLQTWIDRHFEVILGGSESSIYKLQKIYVRVGDMYDIFNYLTSRPDSNFIHLPFKKDSLLQFLHNTQLLAQYIEVLIWVVNHNVLDYQQAEANAAERRKALHSKLTDRHDSDRHEGAPGLFVDMLLEKCIPPSHTERALTVRNVLHMFRAGDPAAITAKRYLLLYILIDMNHDNRDEDLQLIEDFTHTFMLSDADKKIVTGLWKLDCISNAADVSTHLAEACSLLINPQLVDESLKYRIAAVLYEHAAYTPALQFITAINLSPSNLHQLHLFLFIYLHNGLLHEAINLLRAYTRNEANKCTPEEHQQLLNAFFEFCQNRNMGFVFQLNLDSFEGECLVQYLKASPQPAAMELLLLFYLQRSNFREAIHLVDTLQKTAPTKQALSLSTALIDNYKLIFPSSSLKIPQPKEPEVPAAVATVTAAPLVADSKTPSKRTPFLFSEGSTKTKAGKGTEQVQEVSEGSVQHAGLTAVTQSDSKSTPIKSIIRAAHGQVTTPLSSTKKSVKWTQFDDNERHAMTTTTPTTTTTSSAYASGVAQEVAMDMELQMTPVRLEDIIAKDEELSTPPAAATATPTSTSDRKSKKTREFPKRHSMTLRSRK